MTQAGRTAAALETPAAPAAVVAAILEETLPSLSAFCRLEERHFCVPSRKKIPFLPKIAIMTVFPYLTPQNGGENLCIYSQVRDYHEVVYNYLNRTCAELKKAFPDNGFFPLADNSPLDEITAASEAGLGVRGRNGLLITPDYGSFVFVGAVLTDIDLPCKKRVHKGCYGCGRCVDSCPTGALKKSGVDEVRCVSYITQKKGKLTAFEENAIKWGGLAWGCDVCQSVCPMNHGAKTTNIPEFLDNIKKTVTAADLDDLSGRAYGWRGREVLERNIEILESKRVSGHDND